MVIAVQLGGKEKEKEKKEMRRELCNIYIIYILLPPSPFPSPSLSILLPFHALKSSRSLLSPLLLQAFPRFFFSSRVHAFLTYLFPLCVEGMFILIHGRERRSFQPVEQHKRNLDRNIQENRRKARPGYTKGDTKRDGKGKMDGWVWESGDGR